MFFQKNLITKLCTFLKTVSWNPILQARRYQEITTPHVIMTAMAMMDKTTTTIWRFMIIKLNIIVILWVMSMCSNQRTEARHDISRRRLSEPLLGRIVQTLCTTARQHPGAFLSTRRVDHQLDISWPLSHQPHMRVSAPVSNATERVHYFAE